MEEEQSGLNWPFVRLCAAALAFLVFYEVVQWKQRRRQGASAHARGSGAAVAATLAASEFRRVCAASVLEPPADIERTPGISAVS